MDRRFARRSPGIRGDLGPVRPESTDADGRRGPLWERDRSPTVPAGPPPFERVSTLVHIRPQGQDLGMGRRVETTFQPKVPPLVPERGGSRHPKGGPARSRWCVTGPTRLRWARCVKRPTSATARRAAGRVRTARPPGCTPSRGRPCIDGRSARLLGTGRSIVRPRLA